MKKLKNILLYTLVVLAGLVLAIAGIGSLLPQGHTASQEVPLGASPPAVFSTIADVARYPEWRRDVSRVEVLGESPLRWREHSGGDVITFERMESKPPSLMQVRIADPDLPFGGTWTYELQPADRGTRLVITERGEVYNPVFRFLSKFVFGHTATLERFSEALRARLG
jgi:hypothetical protein